MKVILLNNNPAVSKLVSVSLNKLEFEFVEIDNLESLASGDADLIICDSGLYDSRVDYLKYAKNQLFLIPRAKFEEYNLDPKNTLQKPFLPTDFIDIIKEILNIKPTITQNNDITTQTTSTDNIKIGNEFGEIQDLDSISFDSGDDLSSFGDFSDDELLGDTKHIDDLTDKKDDEMLNLDELNEPIEDQFVENEFIETDKLPKDEPMEDQFVENQIIQTDELQNADEPIELDDKNDDEIFELDDEISEISDDGNIDLNSDEIKEINDEISQIDEKISDDKDIELDMSALDNLLNDKSEVKNKEPIIEIQEVEEPKEIENLDYLDNLNELSNMLDEIDNMDCGEEIQTDQSQSSYEAKTIDEISEIDIKKALNETITQTDETAQNQTSSIDITQANTNDSSQTDINRDELAKILSKQIGDEISKALSNSALKDILKDIDINVNISFKGKK
ncbi:MAG: hypothetical protein SPI60_04910 [Campylobacter lanienae]|nr:hypothetical protein [Campylobacter lanienae]